MRVRRTDVGGPTTRVDRLCLAVAALLVISGVVHLVVFALDDRPWAGPLSWRKPATFGLSFGLTLATVAWVSSYLRIPARRRAVLLTVLAADCVVEVAGVTLQAWRDVPSHLNRFGAVNAVVATGLAVGGAVLIVVLGSLAVTALRGRVDGDAPMRLAVRAGFGLLVLGLLAGAAMIAVGTVAMNQAGRGTGYDVVGFLKAFHGVTLHAVLVLPALAWALGRGPWSERTRTVVVGAAVAAYVGAAATVLGVELATFPGW